MSVRNPPQLTETLKNYYDRLFQDGYLVSVHVSKWGMGTQLNKDDLNIDAVPKLFKLGRKMLIDPKHLNAFSSIEGKARRYLYSNSYDFPVAEAHFVPKRKMPEVIEKLNRFRLEYQELVDEFIVNYDEYKQAVLDEYPDLVDMLTPLYPAKATLPEKFGFRYSIFELSIPRKFDEVDIKAVYTREEALSEAKAEAKEEVDRELAVQYRQSMEQLTKFTEEAAKALRSQIVTLCQNIIGKIERKEILTRLTFNNVREEINNFRSLNFLDDQAVEAEIDKLEKLVDGGLDFKNDAEALQALNSSLNSVLNTANNLADIPTVRGKYFRAISLE